MRPLTLLLVTVFVLSGSVYAQDELSKPISGGVLNGKAVKLPKPAYPVAARAVNAEGAVSVQVLIDEQGRVMSASAVSGHPLLRAAAVEAAQNAEFSPTRLSGNPVKVSGVITYNFVGTLTPGMFGYEIAYATRTGQFREFLFAKSLAARLPDGMAAERETLESLTYEAPKAGPASPEPQAKPSARGGSNIVTIKGLSSEYGSQRLTPESVARLRALEADVEGRLAANPEAHWNFRLGKSLGAFVAEIGDGSKVVSNIAELEGLAAIAPQTYAGEEKLRALIERARSGEFSPVVRDELVRMAQDLRNIRASRW